MVDWISTCKSSGTVMEQGMGNILSRISYFIPTGSNKEY